MLTLRTMWRVTNSKGIVCGAVVTAGFNACGDRCFRVIEAAEVKRQPTIIKAKNTLRLMDQFSRPDKREGRLQV
jgi:predicted nucleic acid-binding Zn ribbon protein